MRARRGFAAYWFCLLALAAILIAGDGVAATAAEDFIHADGTRLVDARGEPFAVKGINLGNWLVPEGYMFNFKRARSPGEIADVIAALIGPDDAARFWNSFRDRYVSEDDIRFIKAAGFNTVRIPLHWRMFVEPGNDASGDRFEGPGWALLDRVVRWCRQYGLRAIVDLHAAPGGQTGVNHDDGFGFPLTFYVPRYRDRTIALWRALAAHYRDEPAILGYDLLNEPISPYSDEGYLNPRLEPLYRDIVAAIRSVDGNHLVLLAGGQWSGTFAAFGRPFDGNAVYTYHMFWAHPSRDSLQRFVDFSNRWNVPVLIGETGEMNDDWNRQFRELHERFGIGWVFWPYKSLSSHTSVVSVEEPAGWDVIAKAGSVEPKDLDRATLPPRDQARQILDAYLDAVLFKNCRINGSYIASLGLKAP